MTYRTGPVGALMDEYERAASELKAVLAEIPADTFVKVLDEKTKDEDCRSIQTILHHVVSAGYGYSNYIRKHFKTNPAEKRPQLSFANSVEALSLIHI